MEEELNKADVIAGVLSEDIIEGHDLMIKRLDDRLKTWRSISSWKGNNHKDKEVTKEVLRMHDKYTGNTLSLWGPANKSKIGNIVRHENKLYAIVEVGLQDDEAVWLCVIKDVSDILEDYRLKRIDIVRKYVADNEIDLSKRRDKEFYVRIAMKTGLKYHTVRGYMSAIRVEKNVIPLLNKWTKRSLVTPNSEYIDKLRSMGFIRRNPNGENGACKKIIKFLDQIDISNVHGTMFGTPTAHCMSDAENFKTRVLNDNLLVANKLKSISDSLSFHIGNRKGKAERKIAQWMNFIPDAYYESINYDHDYYYNLLDEQASYFPHVVAVYMSGGERNGYHEMAERLTEKHDNITIINMYYKFPGHYRIQVYVWRI